MRKGWEIIRDVVKANMNIEVSESKARKMYGAFVEDVTGALKGGSSVMFSDICSFKLERKPATQQRKHDMRTGETRIFDLPARTVVRFRAAKNLAGAVVDVTDVRND